MTKQDPYREPGQRGNANLQRAIDLRTITASDEEQRELERMARPHRHDLGITISVGDLEASQMAEMRRILEDEVDALVDRVNAQTEALTGQRAYWYVSYDGRRGHGCNA